MCVYWTLLTLRADYHRVVKLCGALFVGLYKYYWFLSCPGSVGILKPCFSRMSSSPVITHQSPTFWHNEFDKKNPNPTITRGTAFYFYRLFHGIVLQFYVCNSMYSALKWKQTQYNTNWQWSPTLCQVRMEKNVPVWLWFGFVPEEMELPDWDMTPAMLTGAQRLFSSSLLWFLCVPLVVRETKRVNFLSTYTTTH